MTFALDTPVPPSPSISDASSSMKRVRSARAERSLRRQVKIEKELGTKGPTITKPGMKASRRRIDKNDLKQTIYRKGPSGKEEEVVKVKLITGTLFLYKGTNRRDVFV